MAFAALVISDALPLLCEVPVTPRLLGPAWISLHLPLDITMTSSAVATFNVKNLTLGVPPGDTDVAIGTTLKKRFDDTTLSFSFTDASLKDPARGQGIVLGAERKLTGTSQPNVGPPLIAHPLFPHPFHHRPPPQTTSRPTSPTTGTRRLPLAL